MMQPTSEWISGRVMIPDLLRAAPQVRPVLDRYGLRGCGGEQGPAGSLEYFARAHEVPLPALLDELRAAGGAPPAPPQPADRPAAADAIYRPFFIAGGVLPRLVPDGEAARLHFSHARSGAARYAITV